MFYKKTILIIIILVILINFNLFPGKTKTYEWIVYIDNRPFNGTVSVSGDVVMVNVEELAEMLHMTYEYNETNNMLKINGTVYPALKENKNGKLMISLEEIASMLGARYNFDKKVYIVSMETFHIQIVPPQQVIQEIPVTEAGYTGHSSSMDQYPPYYCGHPTCPGHSAPGDKCPYYCGHPTCPGHGSRDDHCAYYCDKPGCPGHSSPSHRCP